LVRTQGGRAEAYARRRAEGIRKGRADRLRIWKKGRGFQEKEGRVYARNKAEPKRRGGPRALGFQSNLYNLKEEKNKSSNAKYSQNYSILVNEE
jgi:hypothetical protein